MRKALLLWFLRSGKFGIKDMNDRDQWGRSKYKTPLQPFNGRDVVTDIYQELLDACVYMRQLLFERDGK